MEYLRSIETGDIDDLPDGYQRIYLRRYAKEIGLDDDQILDDFDLLSGKALSTEKENRPTEESADTEEPQQLLERGESLVVQFRKLVQSLNLDRIHKGFWIAMAALTILSTGYFTYQSYMFELENEKLEVKEISISQLIEDMQTQDSVLTPQLPENSVLKSEERPLLVVELRAVERTWVREIRDRADTTEYILPTGIRRSIEAIDEVSFRLGRADGVEIWLNGTNLGLLGKADEVVLNLVLTDKGISEKRLKRVIKPVAPESADSTDQIPALNSGI